MQIKAAMTLKTDNDYFEIGDIVGVVCFHSNVITCGRILGIDLDGMSIDTSSKYYGETEMIHFSRIERIMRMEGENEQPESLSV